MVDKSKRKCLVQNDACKNLPVTYEYQGKNFCVIHAPNTEKAETLKREIKKKLDAQDYNFQGWYFSCDVEFFGPSHSKSFIFMDATFTGNVTFSGVFEEELDFRHALFDKGSRLTFRYAQLNSGLDLRHATIQGYVRFEGDESMEAVDGELIDRLNFVFNGEEAWLDLQSIIIEKGEQIIFHTTRLEPNWFVNVDCRKFVFTDCRWMKADGKPLDALDEVDKVYMENGVTLPPDPNALLTQTCLQLAENYQTNKVAETSSLFWRLANESKRLAEYRGYKVWSLHWWYWLLSFYGESWRRAALWLLLLITFFSLAYASSFTHFVNSNKQTLTDKPSDNIEQQIMNVAKEADEYKLLNQPEALFYAVRVGTLQRPEPQPYNNFAKGLVTFETILVPLQTALFALAVRRKFMR